MILRALVARFILIRYKEQNKCIHYTWSTLYMSSNFCINNVDLSKWLDSNIEARWNTKSQPQISHGVRKFAISVGFDYQLEWMVMHNGTDLTKLGPGIPFVCSLCKRKRGPRDHLPGIEGRVHDTCRQKLVIRLYAARFGNPWYIGFAGGGRSDLCLATEKRPVHEEYQLMRQDKSRSSERADISEICWEMSITENGDCGKKSFNKYWQWQQDNSI